MNSLHDARIQDALKSLHAEARRDPERRAAQPGPYGNELVRMGELYLSVSPEEGRLLYLLARGSGARVMVEFGASYGISTLYLAAAARDNGGRLITTEVHPDKCAALHRVLARAGLEEQVTLLEGDACETLRGVEGPVDFVFLDGWKSLYLPILDILLPKLRPGTLLVADNIDHEAAAQYGARVRSDDRFVSQPLGKQEITCYTG